MCMSADRQWRGVPARDGHKSRSKARATLPAPRPKQDEGRKWVRGQGHREAAAMAKERYSGSGQRGGTGDSAKWVRSKGHREAAAVTGTRGIFTGAGGYQPRHPLLSGRGRRW